MYFFLYFALLLISDSSLRVAWLGSLNMLRGLWTVFIDGALRQRQRWVDASCCWGKIAVKSVWPCPWWRFPTHCGTVVTKSPMHCCVWSQVSEVVLKTYQSQHSFITCCCCHSSIAAFASACFPSWNTPRQTVAGTQLRLFTLLQGSAENLQLCPQAPSTFQDDVLSIKSFCPQRCVQHCRDDTLSSFYLSVALPWHDITWKHFYPDACLHTRLTELFLCLYVHVIFRFLFQSWQLHIHFFISPESDKKFA